MAGSPPRLSVEAQLNDGNKTNAACEAKGAEYGSCVNVCNTNNDDPVVQKTAAESEAPAAVESEVPRRDSFIEALMAYTCEKKSAPIRYHRKVSGISSEEPVLQKMSGEGEFPRKDSFVEALMAYNPPEAKQRVDVGSCSKRSSGSSDEAVI